MKALFSNFYSPVQADFDDWWKRGLFVFDTNVLLDFYRLTPETSNQLLDIFKKLAERVWIPYQVAYEYHKNRPSVIEAQASIYTAAKKILNKLIESAKSEITSNSNFQFSSHPYIDKDDFFNRIQVSISELIEDIKTNETKHTSYYPTDAILHELTTIFEGKVGQPYTKEKLDLIYKDGKSRFENKVPPGYEDEKTKDGNSKYGDLVLWNQIIEKAADAKIPIIMVTSEQKPDWWWKTKSKTIGPKPELIAEMREKAGVPFYLYKTSKFMEFAKQYLPIEVRDESIKEVSEMLIHDAKADKIKLTAVELLRRLNRQNEAITTDAQKILQRMQNLSITMPQAFAIPHHSEIWSKVLENQGLKAELSARKKALEQALAEDINATESESEDLDETEVIETESNGD